MDFFTHVKGNQFCLILDAIFHYMTHITIYLISPFQTGTCSLFFAAQGGFLDIVKELLAHGAQVDLPSYVSTLQCNDVNKNM